MNEKGKIQCPICGAKGAMWHGEKDRTITYKGHTRPHRSLGWWCDACGDGVLGKDSNANDYAAYQALIASVDGVRPQGADRGSISIQSVTQSAFCTTPEVAPESMARAPAYPFAISHGTN